MKKTGVAQERICADKKLITLRKKLLNAGYVAEFAKFCDGRDVLKVAHDYEGIYPASEAIRTHQAVAKIAISAGYRAEARGCYTGTLIFKQPI